MTWKYKKNLFVYRENDQGRHEVWTLNHQWRFIHERNSRDAQEVSLQEIIDNPDWFGAAPDGSEYYLSLLQELI